MIPISSPPIPTSMYMPHPPISAWGIIKELLTYLQRSSNKATFQMYNEKHVENMKKRGYRQETIDRSIREIRFPDRQKNHMRQVNAQLSTLHTTHIYQHISSEDCLLNTGTSLRSPRYFPDSFQIDLQ